MSNSTQFVFRKSLLNLLHLLYRLTPIGSNKVDGFAEYEDANQVWTVVHVKVGVFVLQSTTISELKGQGHLPKGYHTIVSKQYNTRGALVQHHRKMRKACISAHQQRLRRCICHAHQRLIQRHTQHHTQCQLPVLLQLALYEFLYIQLYTLLYATPAWQ